MFKLLLAVAAVTIALLATSAQAGAPVHSFFWKLRGALRSNNATMAADMFSTDAKYRIYEYGKPVVNVEGRAAIKDMFESLQTQFSVFRSSGPSVDTAARGSFGVFTFSSAWKASKSGEAAQGAKMGVQKQALVIRLNDAGTHADFVEASIARNVIHGPQPNATQMETTVENFIRNVFETKSEAMLNRSLTDDFFFNAQGGPKKSAFVWNRAQYIASVVAGWKARKAWAYDITKLFVVNDQVFTQLATVATYEKGTKTQDMAEINTVRVTLKGSQLSSMSEIFSSVESE